MTVAAAIESGVGGGSEPGLGSASGRTAGKTSESAGTGAAPASSTTSSPQTAQSFRSNWQAQMAVFAHEADGEMVRRGVERETAGSGVALPGTTANTGAARTWAGSRAPSQIQTPVASPVLATAAPLQSAKAASADEADRANGAKAAPSAKAQKQAKPLATSFTPEAFTAVPVAAISQAEPKALPAAGSPVPDEPFNGATQSGSFLNSQAARGETGIDAATTVQPFSIAGAAIPQQLHDKTSVSYLNKNNFNKKHISGGVAVDITGWEQRRDGSPVENRRVGSRDWGIDSAICVRPKD
jgi:hypothetical protein